VFKATTCIYVSNADSREISVLSLDAARNDICLTQTVPVSGQVMPLAVSPDRKHLYAALRSQPYAVLSFGISPVNGHLTRIGVHPLPDSMAYIATDRTGRYLFAASYGGHKVSVGPIATDGVAQAASQVLPTGQNAHAVQVDASNRHVIVSNLGSDSLMHMHFDAATGLLAIPETPVFSTRANAGPRHFVFHPNGRIVYLLNELDASIDVLALDDSRGRLSPLQTLSSLPPGFTGRPWAADLHLTPDARFLYISERSSSMLATFAVNPSSGHLRHVTHTQTEAQPRGFNIDASGRFLVAAGQLSHAVMLYSIDPPTGALKPVRRLPVGRNPNWVEIVDLR
jgi:6-phosphogluconolactonase